MPKVPVYDRQQVSSRPMPTPQVRAPGPSGMEAVGGALQRAGDQVGQLAQEAAAKANAARVQGWYAEDSTWENERIYSPDAGALSRRGENAIGVTEEVLAEFDARAQERLGQAANDTQRGTYEQLLTRRRGNLHRQLLNHERQQLDALARQKAEGAVDASIANAANVRGDPEAFAAERQLGESAILLRAQEEGWPADVRLAQLNRYRERLHGAVLQRALQEGDVGGARSYLEANREELGQSAPAFEQQMQRRQAELEAAQVKAVRDRAIAGYERGGQSLAGIDPADRDWLLENDPKTWQSLRLRADADRRGRRTSSAQARSDQKRLNDEAYSGFEKLDHEAQLAMNVSSDPLFASADTITRNKAEKAQTRLRAAREKAGEVSVGAFNKRVESFIKGLPTLRRSQEAQLAFRSLMGGLWLEHMETHKAPPTFDQLQAMEAYAFEQIPEKTWYGGTKSVSRFRADPTKAPQAREPFLAPPRPGAPAQTSAPRRVVEWLRSPDGTRRVPVYEDGTRGPEEMVR